MCAFVNLSLSYMYMFRYRGQVFHSAVFPPSIFPLVDCFNDNFNVYEL